VTRPPASDRRGALPVRAFALPRGGAKAAADHCDNVANARVMQDTEP
jgi:hypothetical protein